MSRMVCPWAASWRPRWCAPQQAPIATTQAGWPLGSVSRRRAALQDHAAGPVQPDEAAHILAEIDTQNRNLHHPLLSASWSRPTISGREKGAGHPHKTSPR
jgi:hypothetical protein